MILDSELIDTIFEDYINNENLEEIQKNYINYNLTYYESDKYLIHLAIEQNKLKVIEYLLNLTTLEFYNNNEYLNYDFDELSSLNLNNYKFYNFYDKYFVESIHPLFTIVNMQNKQVFDLFLSYNINLNIIDNNGVALIQYIYFNKKLHESYKKYFIMQLLENGATWDFAITWNTIRKLYLYNKKYKLVNVLKSNNINIIEKNIIMSDINKLELFLDNVYIDNYLIKNVNKYKNC